MEKVKKYLNGIEENVSVFLLIVILIILTVQVIARFVFKHSFSWTEEMARYLFIWLSYLTACVAVSTNTHIRIDSLIKVWPKKIRPVILIVGNVIFLAYCIIITWQGFIYTNDLMRAGQVSLGLGLPMWTVYASIPVCHLVMAIRLIQVSVRMIKNPSEYLEE